MGEKLVHKIKLPLISNENGDLSFCEAGKSVPFEIKRVFYISNVRKNDKRGFHAHHKTKQALFCIKGSALIKFDDGKNKDEVLLDKQNIGVLIDSKVWHSMENFSEDLIMLVLASEFYDESDYIRNYQDFLDFIKTD